MNFCIMLLFDTGMRCNEMILMEPEDIKPDYILVKHGKGSKERVVPKSPALSKQLMKYRILRDPLEIAQSLERKRALDADDTCTVYAHLNQPMNPEKMTAEIMEFGYIERYYDRMTGQVKLNDWLQGYGVKIVSDRDRKRGENYQKMFGRSSGWFFTDNVRFLRPQPYEPHDSWSKTPVVRITSTPGVVKNLEGDTDPVEWDSCSISPDLIKIYQQKASAFHRNVMGRGLLA